MKRVCYINGPTAPTTPSHTASAASQNRRRNFDDTMKSAQSCRSQSIHPIHCSMGTATVGAQCPLTSSLGEFLGCWGWLWYPGFSPGLVSIALLFAFHISVFSIHSSSPDIRFHSSIFLRWWYLHPTTNQAFSFETGHFWPV